MVVKGISFAFIEVSCNFTMLRFYKDAQPQLRNVKVVSRMYQYQQFYTQEHFFFLKANVYQQTPWFRKRNVQIAFKTPVTLNNNFEFIIN